MPNPSSNDSVSRRMAVLFVLAIALIVWRASRVEPPSWPAYHQVNRQGEQLFPIAVPPIEERQRLRRPQNRAEQLRQISVAHSDATAAPCDLYARISRSHWRRWPTSREALAELGIAAPPNSGSIQARIAATDLVDDDDGDGRPLDAGELRDADSDGAEVEIHCGTGPYS